MQGVIDLRWDAEGRPTMLLPDGRNIDDENAMYELVPLPESELLDD